MDGIRVNSHYNGGFVFNWPIKKRTILQNLMLKQKKKLHKAN